MSVRVAVGLSVFLLFASSPDLVSGEPASSAPDARPATLEDLYGETGNEFQAVVGFNTREADVNTVGGRSATAWPSTTW